MVPKILKKVLCLSGFGWLVRGAVVNFFEHKTSVAVHYERRFDHTLPNIAFCRREAFAGGTTWTDMVWLWCLLLLLLLLLFLLPVLLLLLLLLLLPFFTTVVAVSWADVCVRGATIFAAATYTCCFCRNCYCSCCSCFCLSCFNSFLIRTSSAQHRSRLSLPADRGRLRILRPAA